MQRLPVICTLLLALFFWHTACAGAKKTPAKVVADTSKIQVRKFDQSALNKYKADKEFDYSGADANSGVPSLWDRFWAWLWDKIGYGVTHIPYVGYILLALCISFLAYIIFRSLGIDPIGAFNSKAKGTGLSYSESLEDINEINFDTELEKAIAQHNYRLAVRLLYLKCLKQLSDAHLIQWQIDKTNTAYFYELNDPEQKQKFGMLTKQFEYVWYGNFTIDKNTFGAINILFQDFKKQLP